MDKDLLLCLNKGIKNGALKKNDLEIPLKELNIDSLQFITLIIKIEEFFGVEIPDEYVIFLENKSLTYYIELAKKLINDL